MAIFNSYFDITRGYDIFSRGMVCECFLDPQGWGMVSNLVNPGGSKRSKRWDENSQVTIKIIKQSVINHISLVGGLEHLCFHIYWE